MRKQTYVFAKGILQDDGFAWRSRATVDGYAGEHRRHADPCARARRSSTTARPTVVVTLKRSSEYEERGLPENESPYEGTPVVL